MAGGKLRTREILLHIFGLGTSRHSPCMTLGGNGGQKGVPRNAFKQEVRHHMQVIWSLLKM